MSRYKTLIVSSLSKDNKKIDALAAKLDDPDFVPDRIFYSPDGQDGHAGYLSARRGEYMAMRLHDYFSLEAQNCPQRAIPIAKHELLDFGGWLDMDWQKFLPEIGDKAEKIMIITHNPDIESAVSAFSLKHQWPLLMPPIAHGEALVLKLHGKWGAIQEEAAASIEAIFGEDRRLPSAAGANAAAKRADTRKMAAANNGTQQYNW